MANNQLAHVEINLSNMIDWSNHQMSQCDLLKSILLVKKLRFVVVPILAKILAFCFSFFNINPQINIA